MLFFDIETVGLPDKKLSALCPAFTPPPHPGEFNPATVKYGNTKDETKRTALLAERKADHEAAIASYEQNRTALAEQHFADFKSKAALDAITGRVLAIGLQSADNGNFGIVDGGGDEAKLLGDFWGKYVKCRAQAPVPRRMVGCNIFGFDLPFLVRRSWILGVDVPATVTVNRRYFDQLFVDLREVWLLGQRWGDCESKLDTMARALGVGSKANGGGVTGADFGRLWCGTAEERNQAVAYLKNDLELTAQVAMRLGVV